MVDPVNPDLPPVCFVECQVRGFIASFTSVTPSAIAFDRCTACSAAVVEAHKAEGVSFVEKACRSPQILEEVSGLEEMRRYGRPSQAGFCLETIARATPILQEPLHG